MEIKAISQYLLLVVPIIKRSQQPRSKLQDMCEHAMVDKEASKKNAEVRRKKYDPLIVKSGFFTQPQQAA